MSEERKEPQLSQECLITCSEHLYTAICSMNSLIKYMSEHGELCDSPSCVHLAENVLIKFVDELKNSNHTLNEEIAYFDHMRPMEWDQKIEFLNK